MAGAPAIPDDAVKQSLDEKGYALVDLSGDAQVLALCDAAWEQTSQWHAGGINRVQDSWRRSDAVRKLAGLPAIAGRLKHAFGREAFPFQTLSFHYGSQQNPHSDLIHFTPDPVIFMCGVWFALEDVNDDAGPLVYYPGSHKLPVLSFADCGAPEDAEAGVAYGRHYEPKVAASVAHIAPERALLRKGQAFIWAANLVHGGSPRRNPAKTRRSLVTHYFFRGCGYHTLMHERGGRRTLRLPADLRTGRFVWPHLRRGERIHPRLVANALAERMRRSVHCFEG